jgi:outer membrane lipoprotein-sorting protein
MNRRPQDSKGTERTLHEFFAQVRAEEATPAGLWQHVAAKLEEPHSEPATAPASGRGVLRRRWATAVAGAGLLALLAIFAILMQGTGARSVSADQILKKAMATTESPLSAGVKSLVVTQAVTAYFVGEDYAGRPELQYQSTVWYLAPDRQRIEIEGARLKPDGSVQSQVSGVSVWDGTDYWSYYDDWDYIRVLRQDPDADIYYQAVFQGAAPGDVETLSVSGCRTASLAREAVIVGRTAYVVELGRPRCGFAMPGSDGPSVIWVDKTTGLVLKTERFTPDGRLALVGEVKSIEVNGAVDLSRFSFTPQAGVELRDNRDYPPGFGIGSLRRPEPPQPISLAEARKEATFEVRVPQEIPAGFEIESIEHHWTSEQAKEHRSHADYVYLRYADARGNWLIVSQGFGGIIPGLARGAPPEARQGDVDVNGQPGKWVEGNPINQWLPGGMIALAWEVGRFGNGWEVSPDGSTTSYGSPLHVGLASNVLGVEQLKAVAESLE